MAFENGPATQIDAVIAAAMLAFGFVYVHPLADGNGRLHRYLIHHVLTRRGFNPPGVVLPISAVILDRLDDYRQVLEAYSRRLLPCIEWSPTQGGNIQVNNDTGDYYRFFDATPHAEFLYVCVQHTIERDLPEEANFLAHNDKFCTGLQTIVDMPDPKMDLLFRILNQNSGDSQREREKKSSRTSQDNGIDIGINTGVGVLAAQSGTVVEIEDSFAENQGSGNGNFVRINYDDGTQGVYLHLKSAVVAVGDTVTLGQGIGISNNTGASNSPHLHYSIWKTHNHTGSASNLSNFHDPEQVHDCSTP